MKNIQIVKNFSNRTEYKMLKDWFSVDERQLNELAHGICVIPAIVLLKLSEMERQCLNKWWREWGNQLIVSPPFHQIDVVSVLELTIDVSVQDIETTKIFNGLSVSECIKTNVLSRWKDENGEVLAADIYEHSGSGCVTLTTVPLLDYRLMSKKQMCKSLFLELILDKEGTEEAKNIQGYFKLNPIHEYILLLASAKVLNKEKLSEQLSRYFQCRLSQKQVLELFQQLVEQELLSTLGILTVKGEDFIDNRGYKAFVREIKRWGHDDGEWR